MHILRNQRTLIEATLKYTCGAWKKSNKINPNSVDGKKSLRSDQKLGRYKKVQRINEQRVDTGRDN